MNTTAPDTEPVPELRLSILGMRCAGCIAAVETALQSVPGVEAVSVNFADHSATVKTAVDPLLLKQALTAVGYDAAVMEGLEDSSEEDLQQQRHYRQLLIKTAVAGCLGLYLMLGDHLDWFPVISSAEGRQFWPQIAL